MMAYKYSILIADRNGNVRDFLRRELLAAGYNIMVAQNADEVMEYLDILTEGPHLMILDLEIPRSHGPEIMTRIRDKRPDLPIIIHSFVSDMLNHPAVRTAAAFVEKSGDTELLKETVTRVIQKQYIPLPPACRAGLARKEFS